MASRFPDTEDIDLVHVENERGGMYSELPEDLTRFTDIFNRTLEISLTAKETAAMLGKIAEEI